MGPNHKSKGLKGRLTGPTPWPAGHPLSRFRSGHAGYTPKVVYKSIQCPKVGGNWEEWPASHVDGHPAIHHLHTGSIKSVEAPLYPYIRVLMVEFTHTTLFMYFSTCKDSGLVVEAQAKPCRESRDELSLRLSSESSFRDR
jgi:hypothetical protein